MYRGFLDSFGFRTVATNALDVAYGEDLTFLWSGLPPVFTIIEPSQNDPLVLRMVFEGQSGISYEIQASTNIIDWITLGPAMEIGDGLFEYTDSDTVDKPARFYRVVGP